MRLHQFLRDQAAKMVRRIHAEKEADMEDSSDLILTEIIPSPRLARCWVTGFVDRHEFVALLYPQHAVKPGRELGDSRISKLFIRRLDNDRCVAVYDRGWDMLPATDAVRNIITYLTSYLANQVYGFLDSSSCMSGKLSS